MSCGVPIITTNAGIVEKAFGPLQKRYILKERSVDALKKAIKKMIIDDKILDISKKNIKMSKHWNFKYKAKDYKIFFDKCIEESEKDDIKYKKK